MNLAESTVTSLFAPLLQGGFAGMALLLLAYAYWLNRQLFAALKENNKVISQHNELMARLYDRLGYMEEKMDGIKDGLSSRPCMARFKVEE